MNHTGHNREGMKRKKNGFVKEITLKRKLGVCGQVCTIHTVGASVSQSVAVRVMKKREKTQKTSVGFSQTQPACPSQSPPQWPAGLQEDGCADMFQCHTQPDAEAVKHLPL